MNLLFVHDGPLYYDDKGVFYEFAYHRLKERYSILAENVSFLIRTEKLVGNKNFTPVPKEITIISVPNFKTIKHHFYNKKIAKRIIQEAVFKADYVVLRTQSSIAQLAYKYVKLYQKPFIVECVGCSWDAYWNHSFLGKIVAPYMEYKTRNIIKHSKYVYYVTSEFLQKKYPTKAKSISCSNVVLEEIDDSILERRLKKINTVAQNHKLILGTAASLDTRYKGQEYVIKAMKILKQQGIEIEYRLAGGHNWNNSNTFLEDLAKKCGVAEYVIFEGNLNKDRILDFYDGIDIYIQPSKQEGLPRAVIEAMSRGCPVLGSNLAGIPELIQKECLFKKGNVRSVVNVIKRACNMDLQRIAIQNFEKSKSFNNEVLEKRRTSFYLEFLHDLNKR